MPIGVVAGALSYRSQLSRSGAVGNEFPSGQAIKRPLAFEVRGSRKADFVAAGLPLTPL